MDKKIVVLPGTYWQVPIAQKTTEMGYSVLLVHPEEDSPVLPYTKKHLKADMFDTEKVVAFCKTEHVDAVISEECDIAMPAVALYGEKLKLSTLSQHAAHLFTDKFAMRDFCKEHGLPYPEYRLCYSKEDAKQFYKELGRKLIMKPLDSNSSRGVFTVEKLSDIDDHFDETLGYSKIRQAVLLERYIEGTEFTVDGIKTPEKHVSLAISEKKHFQHNRNIASELYFTHQNSAFDYDVLRKVNDAFVNVSGLHFGLTHAEYKYENGIFYLIEIAARGGGNLISSHIVPFLSGVDNYQYLIECSLGNITAPDFYIPDVYKEKAAVLKFFDTPGNGGVVKDIRGMELLENNPSILSYRFNFSAGDYINPAKNDAARIGYYVAGCESKQDLNILMKHLEENVSIIYE